MKRIKRLVALIGVVLFVSSAPMTAYAKADNFVLNTGAVVELITSAFASTPQGALVVTLGLLGITAGGAVCENRDEILNWGQKRLDELNRWIDRTGEELSITADAMEMWLTDVGNGMLDTTSECWDAFLDYCCWLEDKVTGEKSSQGGGGAVVVPGSRLTIGPNPGWSQTADDFQGFAAYGSSGSMKSEYATAGYNTELYGHDFYPDHLFKYGKAQPKASEAFMIWDLDLNRRYGVGTYDYSCGCSIWSKSEYSRMAMFKDSSTGYYRMYYLDNDKVRDDGNIKPIDFFSANSTELHGTNIPIFSSISTMQEYLKNGTLTKASDWKNVVRDGLFDGYTFDDCFNMVIGNDLPIDVPVPVPGDTTEDVDDVVVGKPTSDIIDRDGDLDKVRVGDATGELVGVVGIPVDGIGLGEVATPYVGVPGVYPVDTVTGEIIGTDTPIDDVTPGIVPDLNGDYTITGLDEVFPFCVPFDLIALFNTLEAEPEAPNFKFPLPVPTKNGGFKLQYIEVDLSDFDTAARVLRAMELLVFCVGLTLVTRKLIRG